MELFSCEKYNTIIQMTKMGHPFHRQGLQSVLCPRWMHVWCCTSQSSLHLRECKFIYTILSSFTVLAVINSTLNYTLHNLSFLLIGTVEEQQLQLQNTQLLVKDNGISHSY